MMALIWSEIKKLFKNKLYLLLFLILLFLPTILTLKETFNDGTRFSNGEEIKGYDYIKRKIDVGRALSGEVTEDWLEKQKERLKNNNNFEETYIKNAISYGEFVLNQEWKNYDGRKKYYVGMDEEGNPIYEYEELTREKKQETEYVKQKFKGIKHFYYGESTIVLSIVECLGNTGVFLIFYILMLFSNMFNKERIDDRKALLTATKFGKRKIILAKILATILVSIGIPILIIAFLFFIHILLFGIPDMKASFQIFTQVRFEKITPYTFQDVFLFVSLLFIVGSLVIGLFSMLLSSMIHSSYRSLIIGFVLLILPVFFNVKIGTFPLKNIFPITYMNSGYEMLLCVSTVGSYCFYDVMLILKSSVLSCLLIPLTYFIDRKERLI